MNFGPEDSDGPTCEARALVAFGHVCGGLSYCSEATLRIVAGKVLRHTLIGALRQEGHAFTDMRFHAWFAGLTTLGDETPRGARPPRAVCHAILTEIANWGDMPLAHAATGLKTALLAPLEGHDENANAEGNCIIAAARQLMDGLPPAPDGDPLAELASAHEAMAASIEFAPAERTTTRLGTPRRQIEIEMSSPKAPLWAIDMLLGRRLCERQRLRIALPLPGLIRADAHGRRSVQAQAMSEAVSRVMALLAEAEPSARFAHAPAPGRRASSRAPLLMELLAGFGPLRSRQLETMLGATRLGVAGMVESWEALGAISRTTISGSHLLEMCAARSTPVDAVRPDAFSSSALADYDASLEEIDRLLARHGDGGSDI